MGIIGYIAGAIYLISSFIAILNLKGFVWAIVATVTGAIAIFPIWGALFWGFSSSFIWIMFFITIADAVIEGKKIRRNIPRKIEESNGPVFPPLLSEIPGTPEYEKTDKMLNNLEDVEHDDLSEDVEIRVPISSQEDIDTADLNYERTEEDMIIYSSEKLTKLNDELDDLIKTKEKKELEVKKINDYITKKNKKDKEKTELIAKIKEAERRISEIESRDNKDNE